MDMYEEYRTPFVRCGVWISACCVITISYSCCRILQHKVFFGIGAIVLVAIIGLCIFGVVYSQVKK